MTFGKLETVVTYLEMDRPPEGSASDGLLPDALVLRAVTPELSFYRWLFAAVGEPWLWSSRSSMSDSQLREIIHDPRVEVHVLYVEGQPAGFFELDRRVEGEAQLVNCGLLPRFIGRRLGSLLVSKAITYAWASPRMTRLWVTTSNFDHPKAVDFYQRHGFEAIREITAKIDDPRKSGLLPPTAGWLSPCLQRQAAAE